MELISTQMKGPRVQHRASRDYSHLTVTCFTISRLLLLTQSFEIVKAFGNIHVVDGAAEEQWSFPKCLISVGVVVYVSRSQLYCLKLS
jgi:hypothetical protein